ncbi:MAG TPA: sn-glycerol-3-phosphate ABC transporter ATP-binding protein UgpC [Candidatus Hydrogenedens sp.]|nr:sn-glycerol-3-phosphate ABC transporter ATP-binding protein UgpC [Candidatus Hydrogenedens sp.]HOL20445.1 sn-glycerol-3-phosphate ABC transporter ATP-binding protein UgpC [Candidatus Hydrogenedens sp.]HPP57880.1 sn-glycerol-3-phosphate ABC transporter ATP-binding protein UgpC [Candidatus Hydrogenedens sp.]
MAKVELKGLTKIYPNGVIAVKDVTLTINDKEFVVLVGPSGCGKTTTLRMVAGLEEISSGEIYIDGKLVNDVHPKDRDIAMVFQNYALYPHMSVYKNMAFGLMLRGVPKQEIDRRVREAAEILGLTNYLEAKPRVLSGGQRQRVAVGRAIVRNPKVFLFDEPLSNLDAKMRVQMRAEISKLHRQLQATIIYVTHDQIEAMTMGDRIVVMNNGLVQQIGTPLDLYHKPINKFVAGFIGSPPMNMIDGVIYEKNNQIYFVNHEEKIEIKIVEHKQPSLKAYINKNITMGIRPEDISIQQDQSIEHGTFIHAIVDVVEPMGSEMNLYISTGKVTLTARVKATSEPPTGKPITLKLDINNTHFFDPITEQVIA